MEKVNYSQIYKKLTKGLLPKTKDIFDRRFGVKSGNSETLESIGKDLGITRERVRQIEEAGFNFVKKNNKEVLDKTFQDFYNYFLDKGGFKKEDVVLQDLGNSKQKPYILFLLTLGNQFFRVCAKKDNYDFWSVMTEPEKTVKDALNSLVLDIQKHGKLLSFKELSDNFGPKYNLNEESLMSYIEISKRIQKNKEGNYGLIDWAEIKPRGVKDKAFLVFKKENKPLHFTEITGLIDKLGYNSSGKKAHPQTVHNELIKDSRFVLVGRGTYALSEWGYIPGTIKDIITKVLKEKQQPVQQDDVVKEVLAQRLVAKNTVLINLNNKKYFQKNSQGKYFLKDVQSV